MTFNLFMRVECLNAKHIAHKQPEIEGFRFPPLSRDVYFRTTD